MSMPTSASSTRGGGTSGTHLAFSNPSSGKIDQQRKILEELERQKKLLNKNSTSNNGSAGNNSQSNNQQQQTGASVPPSTPVSSAPSNSSSLLIDPISGGMLNANQRAALETAAKTSFGYFIAQDSSFGNTILPVIPRPK